MSSSQSEYDEKEITIDNEYQEVVDKMLSDENQNKREEIRKLAEKEDISFMEAYANYYNSDNSDTEN